MLIRQWIRSLLTISPIVLCTTGAACATARSDIAQSITVDGRPAGHERATLIDCRTGDTIAGPTETDDKGSVIWPQVKDGKYCVRIERSPSSGSAPSVLDHTAQANKVDITLSAITTTWTERSLPFALCAGCLLLVSVPILQFLIGPWGARRDKLMGILCGAPMMLYYQKFRRISREIITSTKRISSRSFRARLDH